jgi:phenylpropionate dioxygenase-like ring-hydroxylating dioxygenase large terminal subunit
VRPDRLIIDEPNDFRVHTSVYTNDEIFDAEMDLIFGSTWVFVAHESELPSPGDYKTTYIGRQPVIVSRGDDLQVRVLLNRCRHRGSVVCREQGGNSVHFQCPYHGWIYGRDGRLLAIAQRTSGYPEGFDVGALGLLAAPRVESYRGLVFASLSERGPDLMAHLGPARRYIDLQFDRSPAGEIALPYPPHRSQYPGNWKFQAENATDGYHVNYVHESFQLLLEEFASESGQHGNHGASPENRLYWERLGFTRGFKGGHGLLAAPVTDEFLDGLANGPMQEYVSTLRERYGTERMREVLGQYHLVIYPSLAIIHGQLRIIRPIAADCTEILTYPYALKGIAAGQEAERLRGYERFFGPAGFGQPDDFAIFALNQAGLQAKAVEWIVLSRGMHDEHVEPDGTRLGRGTAETPIRAAFRGWKVLMDGRYAIQ